MSVGERVRMSTVVEVMMMEVVMVMLWAWGGECG